MPRIIEKAGDVIVNEWSPDEFTKAFEVPVYRANEGCKVDRLREMSLSGGDDYYGGITTLDQATQLLQGGWQNGAERLQRLRDELTPPTVRSRKRRQTWSEEGDDLSVDRALVGSWDNAWRTARKQWTNQTQNIDLYAVFGGAWFLTAEQLFWQGATVVVIADLLEAAGYCVRIIGSSLARPTNPTEREICCTTVVVKDYSEPMRLDMIASVLCHSGVFRSYGFKALLSCPRDVSSGYGYYALTWSHVEAKLKAIGEWDESSIHVTDAYSRTDCIREITRVTKLLGGSSDE